MALLKDIKSLKPMPRNSFPCLSTSHFLRCIPVLGHWFFHQNVAGFCSIARQTKIAILKMDIAYCGKIWIAVLIRIYFLALDIKFSFHSPNFIFTSTKKKIHIYPHKYLCEHLLFGCPQSEGIPKYFPVFSISEIKFPFDGWNSKTSSPQVVEDIGMDWLTEINEKFIIYSNDIL